MINEITPSVPHRDFESIEKIDENGIEYWEARELILLSGSTELAANLFRITQTNEKIKKMT